jgi:hypothetical protein
MFSLHGEKQMFEAKSDKTFIITGTSDVTLYTGKKRGRGGLIGIATGQEFSLLQIVQTGSGVHPTSYKIGTGGSFLGSKVAGA